MLIAYSGRWISQEMDGPDRMELAIAMAIAAERNLMNEMPL